MYTSSDEVRRNNKINEEGGPINPKKWDQRVLEDGGQRWDGNKFPLPDLGLLAVLKRTSKVNELA
jgi:hypothetical protein